MAVAFYMDHHVPKAITINLVMRGVDVLTSFEDGTDQLPDHLLLARAYELKRVLFTQDVDLLVEAARLQREQLPFSGVVHGHQLRVTIGSCVHDLEIIAKNGDPVDLENQVLFLPL